jgi:hypothetical protein
MQFNQSEILTFPPFEQLNKSSSAARRPLAFFFSKKQTYMPQL